MGQITQEGLMGLTVEERAAQMGRLGTCQSHPCAGHDALPSDLHFRRADCVEFKEATSKKVAEDTFARF